MKFSMSGKIESPREVVFDLFTDLEKMADHIDGIARLEKLTEGPVGVGTRFRETRVFFKKEATEEMEFTRFEPGRSYTVECESCGAHYKSTYRFTPDGEATNIEVEFMSRPLTLFAKIMAPIGNLMMGSMMKKCLRKDLDNLKAIAESGGTSLSPEVAPSTGMS